MKREIAITNNLIKNIKSIMFIRMLSLNINRSSNSYLLKREGCVFGEIK